MKQGLVLLVVLVCVGCVGREIPEIMCLADLERDDAVLTQITQAYMAGWGRRGVDRVERMEQLRAWALTLPDADACVRAEYLKWIDYYTATVRRVEAGQVLLRQSQERAKQLPVLPEENR